MFLATLGALESRIRCDEAVDCCAVEKLPTDIQELRRSCIPEGLAGSTTRFQSVIQIKKIDEFRIAEAHPHGARNLRDVEKDFTRIGMELDSDADFNKVDDNIGSVTL